MICCVIVVGLSVLACVLEPPRGVPVRDDSAVTSYGQWRGRDSGLVCLHVILRLHGLSEKRGKLCSSDQPSTITALAKLASNSGYSLVARRLSFQMLRTMREPVIVYLEHEGLGSGSFAIPVVVDELTVVLFDGRSTMWVAMPRDEFDRAWTRYALVPRQSSLSPSLTRPAACIGVLALATQLCSRWRRERASRVAAG
jgi:ABC-type bacteriocin/lantibiotic exporter with double-glycine peptidase domain